MKTTDQKSLGFKCSHCGKFVEINQRMGTSNRNHCNFCLWSKHVDETPGDRASKCLGDMAAIGLTLKIEGVDKYGKQRLGDVMLVHKCVKCGKFVINRIAADDNTDKILEVFDLSKSLPREDKSELESLKIQLIDDENKQLLTDRLFGKKLS